ncbi:D-alanyl-D-alanine carboxypeptidase [Streptomyces melanogenes]|uniref:D-alanyl-D-alanine carboxypeptidase n=1 Tax=Streptomyces melanogenes TaxID=67326 RepID=UPI00378D1DEF
MAGESPDRSEQQQSSGETTPSERDPRVAVFGPDDGPRAASGSGAASGPERNGSAKTSANGSAADTAKGAVNGSGADRSADAPVDQATAVFRAPRQEDHESRDTRLRAAVAAWVATDGDAEADAAEDAGSGAAKTSANGSAAGKPDADAEGADEEPAADAAPVRETVPAPKAPEADGTEDEPAAQEPGDKAAPAPENAETADGPAEATEAARKASEEPDAAPAAEKGAAPAAAPVAEQEAKSDEKPKADAKPEPKADAKDSGPEPEADAEPAAKADTAAKATPAAAKPASEGRAASWGAKPSAESAGEAEAVDQPTAVFKAVKPPVVDQPTTAIRLPKAGEPTAERASTFVPLRSDDVRPDTEKPKAAAPKTDVPKTDAPKAEAAKAAAPKPPASPRISVPDADAAERTRQQPLPPKPPLDLLAELTNTPPPPQTPVRTAVRRFKIWTPLVLLLLVVFAVVQFVRPLPDAELKMTSAPQFTFEGSAPQLPWPSEGQGLITVSGLGTVGRFGEEKPVPIASVTKSMTAYIIMRDHPMKVGEKGASIPVDGLAEKEGGYNKAGKDESTLDTIKAGQTLTQKDALSAVMIPSANNVARLLARWDAGSEAAFVQKMNDTAKQLGMTNTTYTDPSGLNATTVSTAVDQVKLATELVKNPALVDITRQPFWIDPSGVKRRNYNTLVPFNGAIGIKTGSTSKAGGNLLFAATKDVGGTKQTIVGAVFGQHKSTSILDLVNKVSKDVLIATRKSLTSATVIKKGDVVGYVDDGLGGRTPVVATKDLTVAGWSGLQTAISLTPGDAKVPHSAKAGTVVGKLTVGSGPGQVSAPVALQKALAEPGFGSKLTRLG